MLALISLFLVGDGLIADRDDPDDEAAFALLRKLDGSCDPDDGSPGHQAGRTVSRPGREPAGRVDADV